MKLFINVKKKQTLFCAAVSPVFFCCAAWGAGSFLSRPAKHSIGALPAHLQGRDVQFESGSGSELHGWLIPGRKGAGAVVLMHGFRGDRRQMLARASFLSEAGYSVLLFDFQAHGESPGKQITIGYLESRDAQDAVEFMKKNNPGEKLGVIGLSMGGAAAILASPALEVEAIVLEAVYPDIERAVANRAERYLGAWARGLGGC
jgi:alpha-beta hydrolase superfamily lysophospholipase